MKLFKVMIIGGVLSSAGHAMAQDDTASEIRLLKRKLRQLEQRVENQSKREYETQAKLASIKDPVFNKTPASVFDSCPAGKFCYKGITDATLRQDGSIQLIPLTAVQGGLVWHTTPALDLYAYADLGKVKATFWNVGTVPLGYGNPLYDNRGCNTEGAPAATCNGNTSEVRQITGGFFNTASQGPTGPSKPACNIPTASGLPSKGWEALPGLMIISS